MHIYKCPSFCVKGCHRDLGLGHQLMALELIHLLELSPVGCWACVALAAAAVGSGGHLCGPGGDGEGSRIRGTLLGLKMPHSLPKWLMRQGSSMCLRESGSSSFQSLHIREPAQAPSGSGGKDLAFRLLSSLHPPDSRWAGGAPRPSSSTRSCS